MDNGLICCVDGNIHIVEVVLVVVCASSSVDIDIVLIIEREFSVAPGEVATAQQVQC